jgi:hypothetical protein
MKTYRRLVRLLKKEFPEFNVKIHRVKLHKKLFGDCCYNESKQWFRIRIRNNLSEDFAIDTLLHEFAHVLAWDAPGDDHGMAWGKAYSKIYRVFVINFVD